MCNERISEVIASCHCKKVVLKIFNLDPKFTVCHCGTCQLIHNGPWYGANCNDVKIIDGKEYINKFSISHGEEDKSCNIPKALSVWHFCAECGSRLYYSLGDKVLKGENDRYNISIGLLHKVCEEDLIMETENFYDMKPNYYSFHETRKFSASEI